MRVLAFVMRHRWMVGIMLVLVFVSMVPAGKLVPKTFLPQNDESRFDVTMRGPEGTSLEEMALISERIARRIRQLPGVDYTVLTVGSPAGDPSGRGSNEASIFVALIPPTQRELDQDEIIGQVRDDILPAQVRRSADGVSPVNAFGSGGADSAAIQYVLSGPDIDKLDEYSQHMLGGARGLPGVVDVDTTLVTGRPALDGADRPRRRRRDLGVGVADVGDGAPALGRRRRSPTTRRAASGSTGARSGRRRTTRPLDRAGHRRPHRAVVDRRDVALDERADSRPTRRRPASTGSPGSGR